MIEELFSLSNAILSGPGRDVSDKIDTNGLTVSTVLTSDCGWETAIMDDVGTYPVERYGTEGEAFVGHKRWGELAEHMQDGDIITQLGYGSVVPEEKTKLKRREE